MGYIIEGILILVICGVIFAIYQNYWKKALRKTEQQKANVQAYYNLLIEWKLMENDRQKIAHKLLNEGYTRVAVYGMHKLGWVLCNELMSNGVEVVYAIDRNAEKLAYNAYTDIPDVKLCLPDDKLDVVDLIIVTVQSGYREIKEKLEKVYSYKVISLEELVNSL